MLMVAAKGTNDMRFLLFVPARVDRNLYNSVHEPNRERIRLIKLVAHSSYPTHGVEENQEAVI